MSAGGQTVLKLILHHRVEGAWVAPSPKGGEELREVAGLPCPARFSLSTVHHLALSHCDSATIKAPQAMFIHPEGFCLLFFVDLFLQEDTLRLLSLVKMISKNLCYCTQLPAHPLPLHLFPVKPGLGAKSKVMLYSNPSLFAVRRF